MILIESVLIVASRSRSTLVCGHYHKHRHVFDDCFTLHPDKLQNIRKRFVKDMYKLHSPIHRLIL